MDNIFDIILPFGIGVFVTVIFFIAFKEKNLVKLSSLIKTKFFRFAKHLVSLSTVIVILIIIYFVFKYFNFQDDMLPNLLSAGLSVIFIDFLIKERELAECEAVKQLVDSKLESVLFDVKNMILQFIDLEDVSDFIVTEDVIHKLLSGKNTFEEKKEYLGIVEKGEVICENIPLIDHTYFFGLKISYELENLILYCNKYLKASDLLLLIKLKEVFNCSIFKIRSSKLYDNISETEYEVVMKNLEEKLILLNNLLHGRVGGKK